MNRDLTVGNPQTVLWKFCLPMFGSIIFQQLYNIADSLVAGKCIGENALAAVGNSYNVTLVFIAFAFGCNIGCSVIVSQFFGAKEYAKMKTAVYTALISSAVLCAVLMLTGFLCCDTLLAQMKTQPEIMADSALYMDIYILGLPFLFFYNIATGIFSALGDSKTPFYFLAFSSTSNIAVDFLFVTYFHMGIAGVAWATFLCQGISCLLSILLILKRLSTIQTNKKAGLFSFALLKKLAVIAIPSILQQSFISVGNIFIQSVINSFGISVTAGYSAAVKLNNLVITSFTTLGNGVSNFTAQNIGAGIPERVKDGRRAGLKLVWCLSVPIVLLYILFGKELLLLFMDSTSAEALLTGKQFLWILSPFYFVVSAKLVTDGVLRGAGAMKLFMAATFTDLILRVVLAYVFSSMFGVIGIWCAWPIGWMIATAMSVYFYRHMHD
ncbi:MAG: MATE family efflux transporter [Lachnospiraceae bacterium]|nr:MATE family efflux transporter [Lachnospiraceae bacterium]MDE7184321.1 MATE family efflux transporter [Lachnospiraceae bacterium]